VAADGLLRSDLVPNESLAVANAESGLKDEETFMRCMALCAYVIFGAVRGVAAQQAVAQLLEMVQPAMKVVQNQTSADENSTEIAPDEPNSEEAQRRMENSKRRLEELLQELGGSEASRLAPPQLLRVPERWDQYAPCNAALKLQNGACIVPVKSPLSGDFHMTLVHRAKEGLAGPHSQLFSVQQAVATAGTLANGCPLCLVVDLTNTDRHYEAMEMRAAAQNYVKLHVEGRSIPTRVQLDHFNRSVSQATHTGNSCVLVHCTHGVNRTGYFIVNFLLEMKHVKTLEEAHDAFYKARGYKIDKEYLLRDLERRHHNK